MNIPKYENTISTITQIALPQPDMSCRRNRSPKIVISNQNHSTKINIEKTSARKFGNVKPPGNNMIALHSNDQVLGAGQKLNLQFLQTTPELLQAPPAKPLPWSRRTGCAALCPPAPRNAARTLTVVILRISRNKAALPDCSVLAACLIKSLVMPRSASRPPSYGDARISLSRE